MDLPPGREYKELTYIGRLNPLLRRTPHMPGPNLTSKPSKLKEISPEDWDFYKPYTGEYFWNVPSSISADKAEMKIDESRPKNPPDDCFVRSLLIADRMLEIPLAAKEWTDEQTIDHLDLTKGVSLPLRFFGFKTRKELFESDFWKENYEDIVWLKKLMPMYESRIKEELADIQDFKDGKIRSFQTTGAQLLYWQLRLFGAGNENLKNIGWSKYGFNPFFGGVNKWYREINVKDEDGLIYRIRICWDISGYDRKINLKFVALRRLRLWLQANPNSKYKAIAEWVARAWIKSVLVFLNGDVVLRELGNNSGSGTTTTNNIEAGYEVCADLLNYTYHKKYGCYPDPDLVIQQLIALFGDDNAMFLMDRFSFMLDQDLVKQRLYNQHGLVCKWLVGGVEHPFNELPFLGFVFSPYKEFFIPKWNLGRLLHPVLYTPNRKSMSQYLQQVYSLMILSFAHYDIYHRLRQTYATILNSVSDSGDPGIKAMLFLGVPTEEDVAAFYLGFESNTIPLKVVTGGGGPLLNFDFNMHSNAESKISNISKYLGYGLPIKNKACPSPSGEIRGPPLCVADANKNSIPIKDIEDYCANDESSCPYPCIDQSPVPKGNLINEIAKAKEDGLFPNKFCNHLTKAQFDMSIGDGKFIDVAELMKGYNTLSEAGTTFSVLNTNNITIFAPTFRGLSDNTFEAFSTVLVGETTPRAIFGHGETAMDAFLDWKSNLADLYDAWTPPVTNNSPLFEVFRLIRSLPPPPKDHPLYYVWEDQHAYRFLNLLKLCGDVEENPGPLMSEARYLKQNEKKFSQLSAAQKKEKYAAYVLRTNSRVNKAKPNLMAARNPDNNKIAPNRRDMNKMRSNMNPGPFLGPVPETAYGSSIRKASTSLGIFQPSPCASNYFGALNCPFYLVDKSCLAKLKGIRINMEEIPCIPRDPNPRTRKFYAWYRNTVQCNASGFIFFALAPRRIVNNSAVDMSTPPLIYSGPSYVGTAGQFPTVLDTPVILPAFVQIADFNTDYPNASVVNVNGRGTKYRIVGCGLRVRYTGTQQSMAGLLHCFVEPNHDSIAGATVSDINQFETYFSVPVSRQWTEIRYTPVMDSEFSFLPDYPYNPGLYLPSPGAIYIADSKNHYMGIMATDMAVGTSLEFQMINIWEAVGPLVRGLSDTPVDIQGTSVVLNASTPQNGVQVNKASDLKPLFKAGADVLSTFVPAEYKPVTESVRKLLDL